MEGRALEGCGWLMSTDLVPKSWYETVHRRNVGVISLTALSGNYLMCVSLFTVQIA